jgi:hypothetical protein
VGELPVQEWSMSEIVKKPLIPQRVLLLGEGVIPRHVVEGLEDQHMQIFMREHDPRKWPQEMEHLVQYLPAEDRLEFLISAVLHRHDDLLRDLLERWIEAVWKDLGEEMEITPNDRGLLIEAMTSHAVAVVSACARCSQVPLPFGGE